ncbi:MAG: GyrI-like domain-containing protein [Thermotogota bacterium]|nr:GyrI-like domain-containing protein [Thermotogota bacterium]
MEQFNKRMSEVRDAVPGCAYGLMSTDIDPVSMEKWDYMACIEVKSFKDIPEGMVEVEVLEQTYAIFTHKGKLDKLRQYIIAFIVNNCHSQITNMWVNSISNYMITTLL